MRRQGKEISEKEFHSKNDVMHAWKTEMISPNSMQELEKTTFSGSFFP